MVHAKRELKETRWYFITSIFIGYLSLSQNPRRAGASATAWCIEMNSANISQPEDGTVYVHNQLAFYAEDSMAARKTN
jgi:hypothetical protein